MVQPGFHGRGAAQKNQKLAHMFGGSLKETMVFALKKEEIPEIPYFSNHPLISHISLKVKQAEALVLPSSPAIRGLAMEWPGVSKSWQQKGNLRIICSTLQTLYGENIMELSSWEWLTQSAWERQSEAEESLVPGLKFHCAALNWGQVSLLKQTLGH